jgi:hypothetical protein
MIEWLLLLGADPQVIVTQGPSPAPPPTVGSETIPGLDLTCTLVDRNFAHYGLTLQLRGGRGYLDPESNFPRRSRVTVAVVRDETNLFSGDDRLIGDFDGYHRARVEATHPEHGFVKLETLHADRDRVVALVHTNALAETVYTGFCDTERHPQKPLTAAETREYLDR